MTKLDGVLKDVVEHFEGSLACAVVDLTTGLLLGISIKTTYFSEEFYDVIAAAAVDMFRGNGIRSIENLLSIQSGKEISKTMKEIQMSTDRTYHFMTTLPEKQDALLILITDKTINLGMGWVKLRNSISKVEPHCP